MHNIDVADVGSALQRLLDGNAEYLLAAEGRGDVSEEIRHLTHIDGQKPYAVVVSCSDSRVIPELIFMTGIGELFTVRTAGNVVGDFELGSIEYATEHLGVRLILVVEHTVCGAVEAALSGGGEGCVKHIADEILKAVGDERDPEKCERLNVFNSINKIRQSPVIKELEEKNGLVVLGGHYHNQTGKFTLYDE